MASKHEVITKITLTPKYDHSSYDMDYGRGRMYTFDDIVDDEARIVFPADEWDMKIEIGKSKRFEKVEQILERRFTGARDYHGGEVVTEILEALGL